MKNTKHIGDIGESAIIAEFVYFGIPVFIPFGDNNSADLIAEFNGKLQKVQIKTTSSIKNNRVQFKLNSRRYDTDHSYSEDEVDYFALFCVENKSCYLVKNTKDFNKRAITLSLSEQKTSKSKYANDYSFLNVLNF